MKLVTALLLTALLSLAACSEAPEQPASDASSSSPDDTPQRSSNVELVGGAEQRPKPAAAAPTTTTPDGTQELDWDALIPEDYRPDKLMADFDIGNLEDDDPRAVEAMEALRRLWDEAPVREDLDGQQITLPGFIVPVEADQKETTGFLLVPYYGACIHVPPPPANQTVYVLAEAGKGTAPELFDVVTVTGTMSVNRIDNDIAEAGYTLYASDIAPYE